MKIYEGTSISIIVLVPLMSAIFWIGSITSKVEARVDNHDVRLDKIVEKVKKNEDRDVFFEKEVIDRLARIETKIDRKQ